MTQPMTLDDTAVKKPRKKKRSKASGQKASRGAGISGFPRNAIAVAVALLVGLGIGRALGVRS